MSKLSQVSRPMRTPSASRPPTLRRSFAGLVLAVSVGLLLFFLLQRDLGANRQERQGLAMPPAAPPAIATAGSITVRHTVSTTHQMVVYGNGRITDRYLTENGQNQIDQDGHDEDATTIAIRFDQHSGNVVDVGVDDDFYTTTLIALNDPSIIPSFSEDSYAVYASKTLPYQVTQRTVTVDRGNGDWLAMQYRICNAGETTLTGGKLLFMLDIDVAHYDLGDHGHHYDSGNYVFHTDYYQDTGYAMGMSLLEGGWRGYGIDGKNNYPDTDIEKKNEMAQPRNSVKDGNDDVSWIVANIPTLSPGQATTISFGLCAKTGSSEDSAFINLVNCLGAIPTPPSVPSSALQIEKHGPPWAARGDTVTYTFMVKHANTCGATHVGDITVRDSVAGSADYRSGDTDGDRKLDTEETWIFTVDYTIQATDPHPLVNVVTVEGKDAAGHLISATDTHSTVVEPAPALQIIKDGPATAKINDTVDYRFMVSHAEISNGLPLSHITVTDDVVGNPTRVGGDTNGNNKLDAGEIWNYIASYTIRSTSPCSLENTATVEGEAPDGSIVTATDTHILSVNHCFTGSYLPLVLRETGSPSCRLDMFTSREDSLPNQWPQETGENGCVMDYDDQGRYQIRADDPDSFYIAPLLNIMFNKYDYSIEAEMEWHDGDPQAKYGLVFGLIPVSDSSSTIKQAYRFLIGSYTGVWQLDRHPNLENLDLYWEPIASGEVGQAAGATKHTLAVAQKDNSIRLYINGTEVLSIKDNAYVLLSEPFQVGLGVYPPDYDKPVDARFDNFKYCHMGSAIEADTASIATSMLRRMPLTVPKK